MHANRESPFTWFELIRSEAGDSCMECALIGALAFVFCMLLLLAWEKHM
jgi:hypothetical protein